MTAPITSDRICIIGAGPSGLAVCKTLREANIPFDCFEANRAVGGLWDVEGSQSGGYRPGFAFLDDEILGCPADELALYRRIAHPPRPNLYFIRFTRVICSLWPVSEQRAKWLVDVLKGTIELPNQARRVRHSVQVSKTLPVFCNSYVADLRRDIG